MMSICLLPKCVHRNAICSKTKQFGLYWRPIGSPTWVSQITHSWTHKIQDSGLPPSWKSLNLHTSTKNHVILMKFGTQQQTWNLMTITWSNMKIFKIEHGRWPSYCKWFFLAITQHLMSNFSEILHREAVIHRISAIGQLWRSTECISCFPNSLGFCTISDTLVSRHKESDWTLHCILCVKILYFRFLNVNAQHLAYNLLQQIK